MISTQIENDYKGFPVVTVKEVKDSSIVANDLVGSILTAVGEKRVDGMPLKSITELIASSGRPLKIKFRDPSRYLVLVLLIPLYSDSINIWLL